MLIKSKSDREQHAIQILKIIRDSKFQTHHVKNLLSIYGSKVLYHSYLEDDNAPKGKDFLFSPAENLVLDYYLMKSKSKEIQSRINRLLFSELMLLGIKQPDTLSKNYHYINIYSGYFAGKDSSPRVITVKHRNKKKFLTIRNKSIWIDKQNHKPAYRVLNKVKSSFNRQLNRVNGVQFLVGKVENPHHYKHHIYGHPHYHFMLLVTDKSDTPAMLKKIKKYLNKDFKKWFGYSPVHVELHQHYYYNYQKLGINKRNRTNPTIFGKKSNYINKIPVKISAKPHMVKVIAPKALTRNNLTYQHHKLSFISTDRTPFVMINSNLLAFLAVDYFIQYLCQDYRLQIKDSDNFIKNKRLNSDQKRLTYLADINSGKNLSVINSISKSKANKIICQNLNRIATKQESELQHKVSDAEISKELNPVKSFGNDVEHVDFMLNFLKKSNETETKSENIYKYHRTVMTIKSSIRAIMTYIDTQNIIEVSLLLPNVVETLDLFRLKPT